MKTTKYQAKKPQTS